MTPNPSHDRSGTGGRAGASAHRHLHRLPRLLAAAAIGLCAALVAGPAGAARPQQDAVPDELVVGLRAGVSPGRAYGLLTALGATPVQTIAPIGVVRVQLPAQAASVIERLLAMAPEVSFVDKNFYFDAAYTPSDPLYASQWHLPKVGAPQAWGLTLGAPGVTIAILDSGLDASHPDLAQNVLAGYNSYDQNSNTADATGHGTEVAGVAGALTDNGAGIAGVAGRATVMPVRVTNSKGRATSTSIAAGLVWATDHGARVLNLSFSDVAGNTTIGTAAAYAYNHGGLVVAAAGNCGCTDSTPENTYMVSVSATDEADAIAPFSSIGPYVDMAAPGTNILTTAAGGLYLSDSGTSLASPLVAGVAALMVAANPGLGPLAITQLLEASAVDVGAAGYDPVYGHGRVDAYAAVTAAVNYQPPADTAPPTVAISLPLAGATVSATTVVTVSASDNVEVANVRLVVDGALYATATVSPYTFAWDTTTVKDGTHTLQAVATDTAGNAAAAQITVSVANAANLAPLASNDAFTAPVRTGTKFTAQVLAVLANDKDPDGALDPSSVRIVVAPNNGGSATVNANGTVSYTPKKSFRGTETFAYDVKDNAGARSNAATVTVTVQ